MPHHTDHPDVQEVKGEGRVVLGCMNSLSLRTRLLSLSCLRAGLSGRLGLINAGAWRAWHARGVQAHWGWWRGEHGGERGKDRWVTEPMSSLGTCFLYTDTCNPASHAALVVPDRAHLAVPLR